jgi:serine/threonine-protein kinase RsbW/stage II sporulation protein AB (anti-sigma F factor)
VNHAYDGDERGAERGPVVVLARRIDVRLVVTVADLGGGIKPRLDSPGVGLGLPMVSALANEVRIDSDDRGAAVSIGFDCDDAGGNASAPDPSMRTADMRGELERAREILLRMGTAG